MFLAFSIVRFHIVNWEDPTLHCRILSSASGAIRKHKVIEHGQRLNELRCDRELQDRRHFPGSIPNCHFVERVILIMSRAKSQQFLGELYTKCTDAFSRHDKGGSGKIATEEIGPIIAEVFGRSLPEDQLQNQVKRVQPRSLDYVA